MLCEQVRPELTGYLYGTLSPQERAAIEAHLSQCEACAEEADAMKEMGEKLSQGLKEWVNQGVCPPNVAARIRESLPTAGRRSPWRRWGAVAVSAAAVAAVLLFALSTQPQLSHQVASVPLLGALAAQLVGPDLEIHLDPQNRTSTALFRPSRKVDLAATAEGGGLTLTVTSVATDDRAMRIQYTARGEALLLPTDQAAIMPAVSTAAGPVTCRSLTADQGRGEIRFDVYCDAVPAGEQVSLTLPALPAQGGGTYPALTATFTN